ncbi:BspA family leucine-rich repeat surface protein [Brachyspira hyodysenteriae]|uniref:BspA family leucine-rich repeat surface protein n=1 Tax=Brachyspira hyodysenteriae TaxID=159 RepID=UPI0022CD326D|nr:BspA family leucine-rich repeat surface protein [Brachyspira hyodysenteriae]MDA0034048.1 BspA family leucine-rich repeat surface protein [Brachyspira hyodysenteriae]MDA0048120.1 BspA family leucine-rich repeat surface protein [Brachyspira hyodysenteriae]MDA1468337.1 BspA family leucine-rich repeat surface protein [Brachyspira hyodysenteriae]
MNKYKPATKEELKNLVFTDSVKLSDIDTSLITDMSYLFYKSERKDFEGIEDWDTSHVEDMSFMFFWAIEFNRTLNSWNVSNVRNMSGMFQAAMKFNQPLYKWNTSNVKTMSFMFNYAKSFNQNINNWNVSKVEDLSYMFCECEVFNQPLNDWGVSNVKTMEGTFRRAYKFNQALYKWDTSNVENMHEMFVQCKAFNQPLNSWNVSNVKNMEAMFCDTVSFNKPLDKWNTKNLKKIDSMFKYAKNYDCYYSLANWDLNKMLNMTDLCDDKEKLPLRIRAYLQAFYGYNQNYLNITKDNVKEIYDFISKDTNKKIVRLRKKLESDFSLVLSSVTDDYNFKTIEEAEKYIENNYNKKDDKKVSFINNNYKVLIKDKSREVNIKVIKYIYLEYLSLKRDVKRLVKIDNIVNLLDKESFIKFIKNIYDETNKETSVFVYGIYGGDEALKNIYKKSLDTKLSLIIIKLNNQSKYALKLLYEIFMTTKKTEVRLEAEKIINELIEIMNIDYNEFRLRYATDFGFNSKGEKELSNNYKLILNSDYSLSLFDIKNHKELKKIPRSLDENLKKEITKLRKEIKKFIKNNSNLLAITLINGNKYSYDIFKDIFIDNIMMNKFASSLIWNLYDKDYNFITTFRYSGDGSYSNCEDEEVKINDNNFISLASPIEMDDYTINKWRKQLEDYEIEQPLQQLTVIKLDKNNLEKEINKIKNIEASYGTFKYFTKKYEMHISNVIGYDGIITYSFTSNDEDIFTMTSKIQGEYDEQINITIDFKKSKNKKEISKRFVYTLLVLIIWDFRLTDLF